MKRTASLLFVLFLGILQLFSQAPKSSLLWKISGKDLKAPSYLFGTSHIMCKEDFTITPILKSSILATKQFYGELKMDDPTMQQQMMNEIMLKDKTLESLMTPEEFTKVNEAFQKITGTPINAYNRFKPFMCLGLLYIAMSTCTEKVQPETEFVKIAKENNLPILGLETVADEMRAIDKQPLDSQVDGLKKLVLNFDSVKAEMQGMTDLYKSGNIDSLYNFMTKSGSLSGFGDAMEKAIVIDRNNNWLPLIKKAITSKPSFFAVGAGHLGGATGMVSLLRKQGYKVTPVKF